MATMKKNTNTATTHTNTKILKVLGDVAYIAVMTTCAISLLVFALTLAQKITITVGK